MRIQRHQTVRGSSCNCPVIVGVGASAGGLEALERMFTSMPTRLGAAFVVVQHLSPDFKRVMGEVLGRITKIPIHRVEDRMVIEQDRIYLIPPKKEMIVSDGRLLLTDTDPQQLLTLPINRFFRSLAHELGPRGIAVVLSGSGSERIDRRAGRAPGGRAGDRPGARCGEIHGHA